MENKIYLGLLYVLNDCYDDDTKILILWDNELLVKCKSITGLYEIDEDSEDGDCIGTYAAVVEVLGLLNNGKDTSIIIYNNCI